MTSDRVQRIAEAVLADLATHRVDHEAAVGTGQPDHDVSRLARDLGFDIPIAFTAAVWASCLPPYEGGPHSRQDYALAVLSGLTAMVGERGVRGDVKFDAEALDPPARCHELRLEAVVTQETFGASVRVRVAGEKAGRRLL